MSVCSGKMWQSVALTVAVTCVFTSPTRGQRGVYNVNLNDFIDANLGYFQEAFPPNENFDGKLLFGEVDIPGDEEIAYINVRLKAIEDFGRDGDFQQIINLNGMTNIVSGSLQSPRISVHADSINAPSYFGPLSPLNNVSIDLTSPKFDIIIAMSPSSDGETCSLNITVLISISEAILKYQVPFVNNRNITDFIDSTIINYFNTQLSSLTIALTTANCDPITTYLTLFQGLHTINSASTIEELAHFLDRNHPTIKIN